MEDTTKGQHVKVISCSQSALYLEETPEILAGHTPNLVGVDAVNPGETTSNFDDVCRLISLAAIGYRSEVRTIGFDQQTVERDFTGDRTERIGLLESDYAGKGDHEVEFERALGKISAAAEAMKDSATVSAIVLSFKNLDCLRLSLACVNHDREITFAGGSKLPFENFDLHVAW